jgi:hypothetical protein
MRGETLVIELIEQIWAAARRGRVPDRGSVRLKEHGFRN